MLPIQHAAAKAAAFVELAAMASGSTVTGITITSDGAAHITLDINSSNGMKKTAETFVLHGYIPGAGMETVIADVTSELRVSIRMPELDETHNAAGREKARRATTMIQAILHVLQYTPITDITWTNTDRSTLRITVQQREDATNVLKALRPVLPAREMEPDRGSATMTIRATDIVYSPEALYIEITEETEQPWHTA